MTTSVLSEKELEYRDRLITHCKNKIVKYLDDGEIPFKYRMMVYLLTPRLCFYSSSFIPGFPKFAAKHGSIEWKRDFPWLLKDQAVNLVKICRTTVDGNLTYFNADWTNEMIYDFICECVENGIHEFDYCT